MFPDPPSLASLWQRTRAMFARAVDAIGAPAELARGSVTRAVRDWIARLEHIVRKLLFAEAAALKVKSWSARLQTRTLLWAKKSASEDARSNFHLATARFAFSTPCDPRAIDDAHAPRVRSLGSAGSQPALAPNARNKRSETPQALRFARRFDALRRVLENPAPHALRLARLMRRLLRRFPEAAKRFALRYSRTAWFDPADPRLGIDAFGPALDAVHAYGDSS